MTTILKIKPSTDTEFFISEDGSQVGVSESGLARLCGVSEATILGIIAALTTNAQSTDPDRIHSSLREIMGKNPYIPQNQTGGNRIICTTVATKIIEYHAQRDRNSTVEAKQSYKQFAQIGFNAWVKSIVDPYSDVKDRDQLLAQCIADIREMKDQLRETKGYQKVVGTTPGLKNWMDSIADGRYDRVVYNQRQQNLLPPEADSLTISEWLQFYLNGASVPKSKKHTLANMVASAYTAMFESQPPLVRRRNIKGYQLPPVKSYPANTFGIIESCWKTIDN